MKKTISEDFNDLFKNEKKIVFQSALGHWNKIADDIFKTNDNIKIVDWKMRMEDIEKEIKTSPTNYKKKILVEQISGYSTNEYLHIFIAPLTWAAKHRYDGQFEVIGPAFGTFSDITLYSRKTESNRNDGVVKIGMVDDDITSNILFKIYHYLLKDVLNTDIRSVIQQNIKTGKKTQEFKIDGYDFPPHKSPFDRLTRLVEDNNQSDDFAIFTKKDIEIIFQNNDAKKDFNLVRPVINIDPKISHFFNLDFVPRSVYCIHKSQKESKSIEIDTFINSFKDKNPAQMIINNNMKFFTLNPLNKHIRIQQANILKYARIKGITDIPELFFDMN